jgi:hypothetical protein
MVNKINSMHPMAVHPFSYVCTLIRESLVSPPIWQFSVSAMLAQMLTVLGMVLEAVVILMIFDGGCAALQVGVQH